MKTALEARDGDLFTRFDTYRHAVQSGTEHGGLTTPEESALLIDAGRYLAMFIAQLFPLDGGPISLKSHAERDALRSSPLVEQARQARQVWWWWLQVKTAVGTCYAHP